jgi:RimJ/RimL family protein N-acetyltransferase
MLKFGNTHLRQPLDKDSLQLMSIRNDIHLQLALMAFPRANSKEKVDKWISKLLEDERALFFIIADLLSDEFVGFIQITSINFIDGIGELGICVLPEMQGKGYAKNSMMAIERYANSVFNLRKVILKVLCKNQKAITFYLKNGYRKVGALEKHHYQNDHYEDVLIMEKMIVNE